MEQLQITTKQKIKPIEFSPLLVKDSDEFIHSHSHFEIVYICEGEIDHWCNGTVTHLTFGNCIILRPHKDVHRYIRKKSCTHRDICIGEQIFQEVCNFMSPDLYLAIQKGTSPIKIPNLSVAEINYFEQKLNDIKYIKKNEAWKQIYLVKSVLAALLGKYYSISQQIFEPYPLWMRLLLVQFNDPKNINKSIAELTKGLHYNQIYICRIFKKYTGQTMTQYLNERRMELAGVYLLTTKLTALNISKELGYQYPYRFNQLFKIRYKLTPTEYRKKYMHSD